MTLIEDMIEKVYSSSDLLEESPFIYDPDAIFTEITTKTNSRYKVSGVNHKPYRITESVLNELFNRIIVVPSFGNYKQNQIINHDNYKLVISDLTLPSKVMHNGDLTPSGLLCVRLGTANGNEELYEKVLDDLSKFRASIKIGFDSYWIPLDLLDGIPIGASMSVTNRLVKAYGYRWRIK